MSDSLPSDSHSPIFLGSPGVSQLPPRSKCPEENWNTVNRGGMGRTGANRDARIGRRERIETQGSSRERQYVSVSHRVLQGLSPAVKHTLDCRVVG